MRRLIVYIQYLWNYIRSLLHTHACLAIIGSSGATFKWDSSSISRNVCRYATSCIEVLSMLASVYKILELYIIPSHYIYELKVQFIYIAEMKNYRYKLKISTFKINELVCI